MALLRSVVTSRRFKRWPTWTMIHEWEEVLATVAGCSLVGFGERYVPKSQGYDLSFITVAADFDQYSDYNLIPVFIDTWRDDVSYLLERTRQLPLVYVTSLQAFYELRRLGHPSVRYIPLSVADKHRFATRSAKPIDLIHFGRRNSVLEGYTRQYLADRPGLDYLVTEQVGEKMHFVSSLHGDVGETYPRDRFMNILNSCKVSIVSSPGVDREEMTGGYDVVSPRFFESAACSCHMVGRFTLNQEARMLGIDRVCEHVDSYEAFAAAVSRCLDREFDREEEFRAFLEPHWTSRRAWQILNDIKGLA